MCRPNLADIVESLAQLSANGRVHIHYSLDVDELIPVSKLTELRKLGGRHGYRLFADNVLPALEQPLALRIVQGVGACDIDALGG